MRFLVVALGLAVLAPTTAARADTTLMFDGEVPADGDYFTIPFTVPAGVAEIEVRHDDLSTTNILDWGVIDPTGFRGYGGGNSESAVFNAAAASRSYLPGVITPGAWVVYVGKAKVTELPAHYHVEVVLRDAITLAAMPERTPYVPVAALSTEARWYAGDFHVHSRESGDAHPTLDEIATFAEMQHLDFVMISDHNTVSQLELYSGVQARHPHLLFVPGIEVTTYQGHAMSMGGTEWVDHRLGFQGRTIAEVAAEVHAQSAIFSINHPALSIGDLCIGCGWMAMLDGGSVDAMEVQTGAYHVTGVLFYRQVTTMWDDFLLAGHHVVAVGGSDDHSAGTGTGSFDSSIGSPTTMVWARELSTDAILEGVRRGRTVLKLENSEDPMVELSSPDLDPSVTDTIVQDVTTLHVHVTGAPVGATLRFVRDGEAQPPIDVMGTDWEHDERVIAGPSEDFIRVELVIAGRPRVVTNHVYLRSITPGGPDAGLPPDAGAVADAAVDAGPTPAPANRCGCRAGTSPPSGALGLGAVLLMIAARARRTRAAQRK
jgi:hypothetical protein